ncbi:MAG: DUF4234 domain-containing protein [Candidatus Saccharimonadales bacterium]
MKHRSPAAVFFLSIITLGIYSLVWQVKTKGEMNKLGANIPTAWLLIIPFVNFYWLWKYSEGVEKVTGGQQSTVLAFVLLFLLSIIGMAIIQSEFNKVSAAPAGGTAANPGFNPNPATTYQQQAAAQSLPDNTFGGPIAPNQSAAISPTVESGPVIYSQVSPPANPEPQNAAANQQPIPPQFPPQAPQV